MPQWFKDLLPYLPNWISAFFTVVIAGATVAYVLLTRRLWKETKKSADAAQKSAAAADKSATAAQESIQLARQQIEEQAGRGPQIVLEAIRETQSLVAYWLGKASDIAPEPFGNPDPSDLNAPVLSRVAEHAHRISPKCASRLVEANASITAARSELVAAYKTAKQQIYAPRANNAPRYLQTASQCLSAAEQEVLQHINQTPQP